MKRLILTGKHVEGDDSLYEIHTPTNLRIGVFIKDVDGFYYFWPEERPGCWDQHLLKLVLDELVKLNKPWNDQIDKEFNK